LSDTEPQDPFEIVQLKVVFVPGIKFVTPVVALFGDVIEPGPETTDQVPVIPAGMAEPVKVVVVIQVPKV